MRARFETVDVHAAHHVGCGRGDLNWNTPVVFPALLRRQTDLTARADCAEVGIDPCAVLSTSASSIIVEKCGRRHSRLALTFESIHVVLRYDKHLSLRLRPAAFCFWQSSDRHHRRRPG